MAFWRITFGGGFRKRRKIKIQNRDSCIKGAGILVISLRVVKCRFCWFHSVRKAVQYFYP